MQNFELITLPCNILSLKKKRTICLCSFYCPIYLARFSNYMQKFQKEKKGCINHLMNEQKGENLCYVMLCGIYLTSVVYKFVVIVQQHHWKLTKTDQ